jgi:FlaG/FlaF family flagellin (archaellin)
MVAITVILATVIGAIVLDFGNNAGQDAPSASLSVDADGSTDEVTLEHTGGDSIVSENTKILVDGTGSDIEFTPGSGSTFSVGDTATITTDTGSISLSGYSGSGSGSFDSGDQITITIIDTDSQRQIYKTTVTAQ